MADLKTKATDASVENFVNGIADDSRRKDSQRVLKIMKSATGEEPKMWGQAWWDSAPITIGTEAGVRATGF